MDFLIAERLSPMNRCQPRVENDCATKERFLSNGNLFIKGCCLNCLRILFENIFKSTLKIQNYLLFFLKSILVNLTNFSFFIQFGLLKAIAFQLMPP